MALLRFIFTIFLKIRFGRKYDVKVENAAYLREISAPVLFISNHPSLKDTVFYKLHLGKEFYVCGAREAYFSTFRKRLIMKLGKIIKVTTLEQFLEDCSRLVKSNHILIYPQMGRHKEIGNFKDWCARVAILNKVNVVPMRIRGTENEDSKKIRITIGKMIEVTGANTPEALTLVFLNAIKSL